MKKIVSILILILVFSSCEKHSKFEEYLVKDNNKTFWIEKMMDSTGNYRYYARQSVFFIDNTLTSLSSLNENEKGFRQVVPIEGGEQEKWNYNENNNTLTTSYRTTFKIEKYSKDTIFMKLTTAKKEQFIMVRKRTK